MTPVSGRHQILYQNDPGTCVGENPSIRAANQQPVSSKSQAIRSQLQVQDFWLNRLKDQNKYPLLTCDFVLKLYRITDPSWCPLTKAVFFGLNLFPLCFIFKQKQTWIAWRRRPGPSCRGSYTCWTLSTRPAPFHPAARSVFNYGRRRMTRLTSNLSSKGQSNAVTAEVCISLFTMTFFSFLQIPVTLITIQKLPAGSNFVDKDDVVSLANGYLWAVGWKCHAFDYIRFLAKLKLLFLVY